MWAVCFHWVHCRFVFAEVSNVFILTYFPLWLLCCELSFESLASDKIYREITHISLQCFYSFVCLFVNIDHGEKRQDWNKTKVFMWGSQNCSSGTAQIMSPLGTELRVFLRQWGMLVYVSFDWCWPQKTQIGWTELFLSLSPSKVHYGSRLQGLGVSPWSLWRLAQFKVHGCTMRIECELPPPHGLLAPSKHPWHKRPHFIAPLTKFTPSIHLEFILVEDLTIQFVSDFSKLFCFYF